MPKKKKKALPITFILEIWRKTRRGDIEEGGKAAITNLGCRLQAKEKHVNVTHQKC